MRHTFGTDRNGGGGGIHGRLRDGDRRAVGREIGETHEHHARPAAVRVLEREVEQAASIGGQRRREAAARQVDQLALG